MDDIGILLVAYGSPGPEAQQAPDFFERLVRRTFPALPVYRAFTSESRRLYPAGGERDSVYRALCRMGAGCLGRVAVQSLHLVPGLEYRATAEEIAAARKAGGPQHIRAGAPLLNTEEDAHEVAAALAASFGAERDREEVVVWVGHGGRAADDAYARLAAAVAALDRRALIGTLAGEKGVENIIEELRALCNGRAGRVRLVPLLAAVGKHAAEDIAGAGAHSWRKRLAAAGFDCRVELKGLAEREDFARIWLARLHVALDALAIHSLGKR